MKFSELKDNPQFSGYVDRIKTEYDEGSGSKLPELTHILYNIYYKTGSRKEYESVYFARRRALLISALMCLIYDNDEYIKRLEYVIDEICGEFTWALPAHTAQDDPAPEKMIDLFAAETGQALSEIYELLGEKLNPQIKEKMMAELSRRIAVPFDEKKFNWENIDNNWSAVCGGSVGMTLIYRFPEVFARNEQRILDIMNVYLSGFGDDGICREGLGYWNYGFWYFTAFADLYKSRYGVDIMDNAKIKSIAMCQQNMFLGGNTVLSFSDSTRTSEYNYGLAHYYNDKFGDDILIPDLGFSDAIDHCSRFVPPIRSVLWYRDNAETATKTNNHEVYFKDCGWYINRSSEITFAVKGGHNDESHNHNDIGSFIIAVNGEQIIADYGSGEYTRDYFNNDMRYGFFVTSSRGHSVPIIDGEYQKAGKDHYGVITESGNGVFEIEMSKAYEVEELSSMKRRFEIDNNTVLLKDKFTFSDGQQHSVTERFISLIKPEIKGGKAVIGNIVIDSDIEPELYSEVVKSHVDHVDETVYLIDYKADCEFKALIRALK